MGDRLKFLLAFAIVGFIAGVGANLAYYTIFPFILEIFPQMLQAEWILSGIAGSLITMTILVIWVYLSGSTR